MSEATFTKAEVEAAIKSAVESATRPLHESIEKLEAKRDEALNEAKQAKLEKRQLQTIKPEDLTAAEDRAEKAEAALKEAQKQIVTLTKERDGFAKSLEVAQANSNSYMVKNEISKLAVEHGVIPALMPAFQAMILAENPTVEFVDGAPSFSIKGGALTEYTANLINGETGKHLIAAPNNAGGGATGGKGGATGKTASQAEFNSMSAKDRAAFMTGGGQIADQAA